MVVVQRIKTVCKIVVLVVVADKYAEYKILILGAIIIVGGVIVHHINKENQELKIKLKALTIKHRE